MNKSPQADTNAPSVAAPRTGSPARIRPGVKVWTETTSGSPILCTVIEPDTIMDGEWVLESPFHGYEIQRHWEELEQENGAGCAVGPLEGRTAPAGGSLEAEAVSKHQ